MKTKSERAAGLLRFHANRAEYAETMLVELQPHVISVLKEHGHLHESWLLLRVEKSLDRHFPGCHSVFRVFQALAARGVLTTQRYGREKHYQLATGVGECSETKSVRRKF